ncbi:peptide chain release factor 2 [Clostridium botulinum]|uniref:Peptide chain release factor 2 n=1 Tax=Clostridium botulinum TaxID=1491 RepID=A0ABC8CTZ7_CLOBO|nr:MULTISPECIES: peptide chain release factor 2 [Clostridium]AVQ37687.1 peptide chain release factor 2 [Clostridium botulinum]AVQ51511.1 peptide chain release factor 2 [Clostridium botulinum]EJE7234675.1 peptide chain release factor 2 [Clostridium botulinum]EKO1913537.1 peptide chain release factor 2 [Clostridium botulinum]EKO2043593.1 peptide chain release factor 2 [Clostridium botulinum]
MILEIQEIINNSYELKNTIKEIGESLDIEKLKNSISELQNKMQNPNFWNNIKEAQKITSEEKYLKDKLSKYNHLKNTIEDIIGLSQMLSEEDDDMGKEILSEYKNIKEEIDRFKIETLLSGEYDRNNAIMTLHSGVGGTDAQDWTDMLFRMYTRWAEKEGFTVKIMDLLEAEDAGIKSVTLKVTGEFVYGYLKGEKGIHRLVRISPFNANGKRQTSFASIEVLPELTDDQEIEIKSEDLKIDTYRAGGAGGQHVNKTESAVRITHIPTGIIVQCQNERSQHTNKETAMKVLKSRLVELKERSHKEKIEDLTGELKDMGWGSQIRSYVFHPYNLVKDHRTGAETSNVDAVMNGDINIFITEYLKGNF